MVITSRESGGTTMIKSVPPDLLYLCAELVTGKSVPVLVGITRLPIGQALAWAMVTLGAVAGTLFSVYASRRASGVALLGFGNRLLQLGFSLALSVSLLLSLAGGIHPQRGPALAVIPVFFSLVHSLPQRHSTGLVSLVLGLLVLYVCTLAGEAELAERLPDIIRARRAHLVAPSPPATASLAPPSGLTLGEVIARALQLFALAFYACVQHAPTQVYFRTDETSACDPAYASHHHARHAPYSLFIGLTAAWVRVLVWSAVCFMPDNALHALLEGDYSRNGWACIILYMTALLYSACWTATQAREQVLPYFCASDVTRLKLLVAAVTLATVLRQCSPDVTFYTADALTGLCVLAALLQIEA
jgi:hypothetical protein